MVKNVTSSERQKRLARNIVDNVIRDKPLNAGELVVRSSYSEKAGRSHPSTYIKTKGVKKALENMGFSEFNAMRIIGEILTQPLDKMSLTPENQIRAAQEVFKIRGSYAPEKLDVRKVVARITFNKPK